jgi:hypothetical protein
MNGEGGVMTFEAFNDLMKTSVRPVVLVEGTRDIPPADEPILAAFASWLANTYPHAVFRTGNAAGSDSAFARGVAAVDARRLEYVLPYGGHRKQAVASHAYEISISDLPMFEEAEAAQCTEQASPKYSSMMAKRKTAPRMQAKAKYILRDTVKVTGSEPLRLVPATIGIFYVNVADPMKGGTGHTVRVCEHLGVPVAYQDEWMTWPTQIS